jgi:hypothetical protein
MSGTGEDGAGDVTYILIQGFLPGRPGLDGHELSTGVALPGKEKQAGVQPPGAVGTVNKLVTPP